MKKTILCFMVAMAMVLAMPTALFASDNLVNADGSDVNQIEADNGSGSDWTRATIGDLVSDVALSVAAVADPSIMIEEENNVVVYGDNGAVGGDGEFKQVSVSSASVSASRYSGTSGNVTAHAGFTKKASKASCTITLQEKYNGSWRTATGVPVKVYKKTVYSAYSISAAKTFTLVKGKVYRAKVNFADTNSSGTYYKTYYTGSF